MIAVATPGLVAQPPRPRVREAVVAVDVRSIDHALVQARYEFNGNPGALSFEWLEQRCARVGPVRLQSDAGEVPYARDTTGPWVRLHDTSSVDPARRSLGYLLSYEVELAGRDVSIPLVLPLAVLTGRRRGDAITDITVSLPQNARVTVPRMSPTGGGRWSARMAALPSAIGVRGIGPNADCGGESAGTSGNFRLIFWALVTTLALWVPTYLWWANRQRDQA
ncbi:MAG: hypothetical protein ACREOG_12320 [Gemmatimonadaceae bacterium]